MLLSVTFLLLVSSAYSQTDQLNEISTEISISNTDSDTTIPTMQDDNFMSGDMPSASDSDSHSDSFTLNVKESEDSNINCLKCDSSVNMKCIADAQNVEKESCQAINGCFVRKDTEKLIRGCTSELTVEQLEDCVQNEKCHLCDTDSCNGEPWPVCYTCMSTIDITCSRKQQTENTMTICNHMDDSCIMMVDGTGVTIRKCGAKGDECGGNCSACQDFLCNDEVFPVNRRKCHQCNGSIDLLCEQSQEPDKQEVCHNYLQQDGCFYYTSRDKMVRGCTSDVGAYNECRINGKSCMTCMDDGCNSIALYVEPTLSCIKCSEEEPSCSWKQPSTQLTKCEKSRPYFHEETCYSNYNRQIRRTARGCSGDDDTSSSSSICSNNRDCKLCNGTGCNGDNFMRDECIVCDDAHGIKCLKVVHSTICNEEGEYDKRGCFTIVQSANQVKKGCMSQLTSEELMKNCTNSTQTTCYLCDGSDSCNNATARNSSPTEKVTFEKIYWQFLIILIVMAGVGET
ncbi:hypothetical protein ACFFRR_002127 [Megaselia abdita]